MNQVNCWFGNRQHRQVELGLNDARHRETNTYTIQLLAVIGQSRLGQKQSG